jgi:hypothetical protein
LPDRKREDVFEAGEDIAGAVGVERTDAGDESTRWINAAHREGVLAFEAGCSEGPGGGRGGDAAATAAARGEHQGKSEQDCQRKASHDTPPKICLSSINSFEGPATGLPSRMDFTPTM